MPTDTHLVKQRTTTKASINSSRMPPCAPPYYPGIHTHRNTSTQRNNTGRRVIFPAFYQETVDAAGTTSIPEEAPEMIATLTESKQTLLPIPAPHKTLLVSSSSSRRQALDDSVLYSSSSSSAAVSVNPLQRPPVVQIPEIPKVSTSTPPRKTSSAVPVRRSILSRYQVPLPASMLPPEPLPTKKTGGELVSILRASSFGPKAVGEKTSSLPSLQSLGQEEDSTTSSASQSSMDSSSPCSIRRSSSEPGSTPRKTVLHKIQFDPRVWIREFERSPEEQECTWYADEDMERFKRHALALIMARDRLGDSSQILATGTTRTLARKGRAAAFYTHSALTLDGESSSTSESALLASALQTDRYRAAVAQQEMKRILLVDPHDICITLFRKAFLTLLPNAEILAASSATQALEHLEQGAFDVILVEERLQPLLHKGMSGSDLFRTLAKLGSQKKPALWIGVSVHLAKDQAALEASGVDLCWGKPPPKMSAALRNDLLQKLLLKRQQQDFCQELFGPL